MKLGRLFQPRKSEFWLMLVLNALSAVLGWLAQTHSFGVSMSLLIAVFAVGNALLGARFAWLLVRDPASDAPPRD
jgi:uncharacterized membrane protein HdeD (DUF308 family)